MFRCISVLLNEPEARGGALAHASEWASRLRLPLRGLEWPVPAPNSPNGRWPRPVPRLPKAVAERLQGIAAISPAAREALGTACGRGEISWEATAWQGPPDLGAQHLFRPFELCVFENELPSAFKEMLFSEVLRSAQTSAMICPPTWRPVSRVLVLNQHQRPGDGFLDAAADICRAFEVTPILLTVARSEAEARALERSAEEAFARRRLTVDCDIVAGCDVTTAVARAVRWRRCSHVLVEHRCMPRWRRWLGGDVVRELAALPDSPALLALHEMTPLPPAERAGERGDVGRVASEAAHPS
jgi:hypothetical protein